MALSKYQMQQKGGAHRGQGSIRLQGQSERRLAGGSRATAEQLKQRKAGDEIDSLFGFDRIKEVCIHTSSSALFLASVNHYIP